MSTALEIDGKFLHPIKDASDLVSYSRDYITRLAREEKITATYIGRQWFVDVDSLKNYVEASALEQEVRKKMLSEERKQENQIREATRNQHTLHLKKAQSLHSRSMVAASMVLMFGLMTGLGTHQLISNSTQAQPQVANTYDTRLAKLETVPGLTPDQPAALRAVTPDSNFEESISLETTQEIYPLGETQNGILLLPNSGQAEVSDLLSDKVVVRELSDGTKVVVRIDATGREIGNPVPFVVVPVEGQEVQI